MDGTSICKKMDVVYFRYKFTADVAEGHKKKPFIWQSENGPRGISKAVFGYRKMSKIFQFHKHLIFIDLRS